MSVWELRKHRAEVARQIDPDRRALDKLQQSARDAAAELSEEWLQRDSIVSVVVIGSARCGKSALIQRLSDGTFLERYEPTPASAAGADGRRVTVGVGGGKRVHLQIWDTPGDELPAEQACFRGADACVLVYDVNRWPSFEALSSYAEGFLKATVQPQRDFPFLVVGTRLDQARDRREVGETRALRWCDTLAPAPFPWQGGGGEEEEEEEEGGDGVS